MWAQLSLLLRAGVPVEALRHARVAASVHTLPAAIGAHAPRVVQLQHPGTGGLRVGANASACASKTGGGGHMLLLQRHLHAPHCFTCWCFLLHDLRVGLP